MAATNTRAPNPLSTKKMPRQPTRSLTTPAQVAPSKFPVMMANSRRPIATWRSATGNLSPMSAKEIGTTPPAASPATMRPATRTSKLLASPQTSEAAVRTSRQSSISRDLLNMSASAPSTGCTSA